MEKFEKRIYTEKEILEKLGAGKYSRMVVHTSGCDSKTVGITHLIIEELIK
jgi:hypothetical protein